MRRPTRQRLSGLLDLCRRKVQRAKSSGTRASFAAVARQSALVAQLVQAELPTDEQTQYMQVLSGIESALNQLPPVPAPAVCEETADLLGELVDYLIRLVRQARTKKLIAFLPYKAAMWDSMETIWMAAERDREHCETMVMPLPYADRNPDGTAAAWHNDSRKFPRYVPTVDIRSIDLQALHPDVIFIHNPYDGGNLAVSVDMEYYSDKLARCTDLLVYVPYYVTSGGMGEFQRDLPVYQYADYIIAQSAYGAAYYDTRYRDKILPLGSPKLDKAARMAANPPSPPESWRSRMAGRTVYFYNTSINGFLADTDTFLKKMAYVFRCFRGRQDTCLLWRPHPLLAATMESMRPEAAARFQQLKQQFFADHLGIYDDTPNIEASIALSDVYIGDMMTSVTALFGAAGKPLFLLNNMLLQEPQADDERGFVTSFTQDEPVNWLVMGNNQLWRREENGDCHYVMQLSSYHSGGYFGFVIERYGRTYICPINAEEIIVLEQGQSPRHLPLKHAEMPYFGRFVHAVADDRYLFLIPLRYPWLVRLDLRTQQITYLQDVQSFMAGCTEDNFWLNGGFCLKDGRLYFGAPFDTSVLVLDEETLTAQQLQIGEGKCGCRAIAVDGDELWLLPMQGGIVRRWNPQTGEVRIYDVWVDGYQCTVPLHEEEPENNDLPFSSAAFTSEKAFFAPYWGNGFICLDKASGKAESWQPPEPLRTMDKRGYCFSGWQGIFFRHLGGTRYQYYQAATHRFYELDLDTGRCEELPIHIALQELRQHAPGFARLNEWIQYGCEENAVQTLPDMLAGSLPGAPYDREAELAAYGESAANVGTSGRMIYETIMAKLEEKSV